MFCSHSTTTVSMSLGHAVILCCSQAKRLWQTWRTSRCVQLEDKAAHYKMITADFLFWISHNWLWWALQVVKIIYICCSTDLMLWWDLHDTIWLFSFFFLETKNNLFLFWGAGVFSCCTCGFWTYPCICTTFLQKPKVLLIYWRSFWVPSSRGTVSVKEKLCECEAEWCWQISMCAQWPFSG